MPPAGARSISARTRSLSPTVNVRRRRPIRQLRSRRRWGWHGGRSQASHRASPSGTIQLLVFNWHNHVISVLRPEVKLFGIRCLMIIGTEANVVSWSTL